MSSSSSSAGSIVICVVPLPVTCPLVTLMASINVLSDLWIDILPVSASTASEKVKTISDVVTTLFALSIGDVDVRVGGVVNVIGVSGDPEFLFANARYRYPVLPLLGT